MTNDEYTVGSDGTFDWVHDESLRDGGTSAEAMWPPAAISKDARKRQPPTDKLEWSLFDAGPVWTGPVFKINLDLPDPDEDGGEADEPIMVG